MTHAPYRRKPVQTIRTSTTAKPAMPPQNKSKSIMVV